MARERESGNHRHGKLLGWGILVYALHDDEGNFNKNSLGAISEAAKLAGELGTEAAAVVVGDVSDDAAAGPRRLRRQESSAPRRRPRGSRSRSST